MSTISRSKDNFNENNKMIYKNNNIIDKPKKASFTSRKISTLSKSSNNLDQLNHHTQVNRYTLPFKAKFTNINTFSFRDELSYNKNITFSKPIEKKPFSSFSITEKNKIEISDSSSSNTLPYVPSKESELGFYEFKKQLSIETNTIFSMNNDKAIKLNESSYSINDEITDVINIPYFKNKASNLLSNGHNLNDTYSNLPYKDKVNFLKFLDIKSIISLCNLTNKSLHNTFFDSSVLAIKEKILNPDFYDSERYLLWSSLFKLTTIDYNNLNKIYNKQLLKPSKYQDDILRDVLRTQPEVKSFKYGEDNFKKLKDILYAYSNFNPKVGYAQGMNFIVASIIDIKFLKDEPMAFLFLDSLIKRFNLTKIYGIHNADILNKLELMGNLIQQHIPKLSKYF